MRPVAPLILPVVATTHGEFCFSRLRSGSLRSSARASSSRDPWRTARTRTPSRRFFVGTSVRLVAMIKGTVDSLNTAGMPSRKLVNARTPLATPSPTITPHNVADTEPAIIDSVCDVSTAHGTPLSVPSSPSSISTQNATLFSLEQVPGDKNANIFP
jgi:hypothetical protein